MPFTITGEVTRPAQLVVGIMDQTQRRGRSRLRLDLAPGQTSGSIPYEYSGNTVADHPRRLTSYAAFPVRGVMTDAYDGQVQLIDDDPVPQLRVHTARRVREGSAVRVRIRLTEETGYESWFGVRVVRGEGTGRRLTVGDVPRAWLEKHSRRSTIPTSRSTAPTSASTTGCHPAYAPPPSPSRSVTTASTRAWNG